MAKRWVIAVLSIVVSLVDLFITLFALSWHGQSASIENITWPWPPFDFFNDTGDLFIMCLIRMILSILGFVIFTWKNSNEKTLAILGQIVFSVSLLQYAFSPTKLLALYEKKDILFVGDYIGLGWNFIGAFLLDQWFRWGYRGKREMTVEEYQILDNQQENQQENQHDNELSNGEEERIEEIPVRKTFQLIFRLLQYCQREWLWHLSGFTWLFLYSLTRIFVPYYTGQVIARVVATGLYSELLDSVKVMTILSLASAISGGFRGGSFEYAYARINRAIRCDLFTSLVHQDVAFYDAHKTGEVTSRLSADCQTMSDTVALNINVFLRNIVMLGGSMLFMMALSWRLSLVTFIIVPVILVMSKIFGTYYDLLSEQTQEAVAHSNDVAEEALSTMRTVRSFACEDFEVSRYYEKLTVTLGVTKKKAIAYIGFIWVNELFQTVIIVAVLWYGGHLVLTGKLQKDLLVSFLLYQMQLGDNLRQMGEVWTGLMQSVGASRKVFQYIDQAPSIPNDGQFIPVSMNGRIEFRNVHFSYPTRPDLPILQDLSFVVEPGQTVALVGPSGGGKSSCIALLEHFYEPRSGQILIDGVPISGYDYRFIHQKVALVGQEPVLFARSVKENIGYGLDEYTQAEIELAAEMANAHSFIMQTSENYQTNVGEKGAQMSGGQKQRIAIARALVRRPVVLLLDEATSALDTESEHLVQEAIYRNLRGRSVILIAHRLSTVEKADKIIVINHGRVEQEGTHQQLLTETGMYRKLVERQMIGNSHLSSTRPTTTVIVAPAESSIVMPMSTSPRSTARSLLGTSFTASSSSVHSR